MSALTWERGERDVRGKIAAENGRLITICTIEHAGSGWALRSLLPGVSMLTPCPTLPAAKGKAERQFADFLKWATEAAR